MPADAITTASDERQGAALRSPECLGVQHVEAALTPANRAIGPLSANQLYRPADLSELEFSTTAELQPIEGLVGQARALEAIRFGTQVDKAGFNLFVIGHHGARMQDAVKGLLVNDARTRPSPSDWAYVNNFADPDRPIAIELPVGLAKKFRESMHKLIDDLKAALSAVFQSEDYRTRRGAIDESFQKKQGETFSALRHKAAEKDIIILRTPLGFARRYEFTQWRFALLMQHAGVGVAIDPNQ
jgi:hypothetical protein